MKFTHMKMIFIDHLVVSFKNFIRVLGLKYDNLNFHIPCVYLLRRSLVLFCYETFMYLQNAQSVHNRCTTLKILLPNTSMSKM